MVFSVGYTRFFGALGVPWGQWGVGASETFSIRKFRKFRPNKPFKHNAKGHALWSFALKINHELIDYKALGGWGAT